MRDAFARRWLFDGVACSGVVLGMVALEDWRSWLPDAMELLSHEEQLRVRRKQRAVDREELTLAYALHRLFLGAIWNISPEQVPLGRDRSGRPSLLGKIGSTSLSHANGAAAFAYCPEGVVGVDMEWRDRASGMGEILALVAHPEERLALPAGQPQNDELLALWVRKEAFLKAAGVGLACDMNTFQAPVGAVLDTGLAGAEVPQVVRLSTWDLHPGLWVALASPRDLPVAAQRF